MQNFDHSTTLMKDDFFSLLIISLEFDQEGVIARNDEIRSLTNLDVNDATYNPSRFAKFCMTQWNKSDEFESHARYQMRKQNNSHFCNGKFHDKTKHFSCSFPSNDTDTDTDTGTGTGIDIDTATTTTTTTHNNNELSV